MHLNCEISKSSALDSLNYLTYHVRGKSQSMHLLLTSDTVGVVLWNIPLSAAAFVMVSQLTVQVLFILCILFCDF